MIRTPEKLCPVCHRPYPWGDLSVWTGRMCLDCQEKAMREHSPALEKLFQNEGQYPIKKL